MLHDLRLITSELQLGTLTTVDNGLLLQSLSTFLTPSALWYMGSPDISAVSFYCLRLWLCILYPMVCNQMSNTLILTYRKFLLYVWATGIVLIRIMTRVSHISKRLSVCSFPCISVFLCKLWISSAGFKSNNDFFLQLSLPFPVFYPSQYWVVNQKPPEFNHLYLTHYHTKLSYHHFLQ